MAYDTVLSVYTEFEKDIQLFLWRPEYLYRLDITLVTMVTAFQGIAQVHLLMGIS